MEKLNKNKLSAIASTHNKLLILGHARCGTGYSHMLLRSFGFDVGHERYARDGISSWCQTPVFEDNKNLKAPWGPTRFKKDTYDLLIHNVRDPINALSSIVVHNRPREKTRNFIYQTVKNYFNIDMNSIENEIDGAVASYYYWNKLIELQNPDIRIRVEYDQEKLSNFINKKFSKNIILNKCRLPSTNYNHREKPKIDLKKISKKYMMMIDELCDKYGYPKVSARLNIK